MLKHPFWTIILVAGLICPPQLVYAASATIMTDEEMDQIHAGGLNFVDLGSFYGSTGNTASQMSQASVGNGTGAKISSPSGNVQILQPLTPVAPSGTQSVAAPVAVNVPVTPAAVSSPVVPQLPVAPASIVSPEVPLVPDAPQGVSVPDVPSAVANPVSPFVPESPVSPNLPASPIDPVVPASPVSPDLPVSPVLPVSPDLPVAPAATVVPDAPASPALPATPDAPVSPATPDVPAAPLVLDILAGQDNSGKLQFSVDSGSKLADTIAPTSSATNVLNVSDTSQQQLSALVNVNAAGSVVPVQLNLTIIYNSQVGSVQSSNALNLTNYYQVQ